MKYGAYLLSLLLSPFAVQAIPILEGQTATILMSGDSRPDNPDNVFAELRLEALSTTEIRFTFDLLSLDERDDAGLSQEHPNAKLDALFFNLAGSSTQYTFSDINPMDWVVGSTGTGNSCTEGIFGTGSGGACFLYEADKQSGNSTDVDVDTDLIFTVTKNSFWDTDDFLTAQVGEGDGGEGIFGAHIQSLQDNCEPNVQGDCTSAFIYAGNFKFNTTSGGPGPDPISEPEHLALFGLSLVAMGVGLRRRKTQQ